MTNEIFLITLSGAFDHIHLGEMSGASSQATDLPPTHPPGSGTNPYQALSGINLAK